MTDETLCSIVLSMVPRLTLQQRCTLLREQGSAVGAVDTPLVRERLSGVHARAEEEMRWAEEHGVQCVGFYDERYPRRLRECCDAPVVLYVLGKADLNAARVLTVVGSRHITDYGRRLCENIVGGLSEKSPGTLIVSGLAYGVDVCAHRAALHGGLPTVGVLAHGLDRIYPTAHRQTAKQMVEGGGALLTEFPHGTNMEKGYFVQRNRIVAGAADASLIVQAARRSGSMVTANLTNSYDRELYACPGRIGDEQSEGCNWLIRTQRAHMMFTVDDFMEEMNWSCELLRSQTLKAGVQQELFPSFSDEEQRVVNALRDADEMHINDIAKNTGLPVHSLAAVLFSLEMRGVVRQLSGGRYSM